MYILSDNKNGSILYSDNFDEVLEAYIKDMTLSIWFRDSNLHDYKVISLYDYDIIIIQDCNNRYYAVDIRKQNSLGILFKNKSLGSVKTYLYNNYYCLKMNF